MNHFTFTTATKERAKARIALIGPTGSGKTYTALVTATGLGGRIALVDTEHGSAAKYADEFAFDTLPLTVFRPTTLVDVLAVAAHDGYDVMIVDSLSHFWSGTGGMLEQVDDAAKRAGGGGSFAGWKEARPQERAMIDALLAYPGHLIVTMRTKTEYVVESDERGRKVPRKVGLKPEQREGIEYEFDIVGDLDQENTLVISKSRAKPLSGRGVPQAGPGVRRGRLQLARGRKAGPVRARLRHGGHGPGRHPRRSAHPVRAGPPAQPARCRRPGR